MLCPKCKTENPEGLKFCNECGAQFKTLCASCGFENAPAAKFCGQCGAVLGVPAPAASANKSDQIQIRVTEAPPPENLDGERKTVTALFADIKGSMDLIEDLDPEEARTIVDPALKLMMRPCSATVATSPNPPATASSPCSARRSLTKTIRSVHSMPRCGCRRSSGVTPTSCASKDGRPCRFGSALTPVRLSSARSQRARATPSMYQSDTRLVWPLAYRHWRYPAQSRSATLYASWSRDTSCSTPWVPQESRA